MADTMEDTFEDAMEDLDISLTQLVECDSLKWIFVGGKGGVGKTTTACSLAVELSRRRKSVLLLSTDPAHNIGDAFCQKFSSTPTLVDGFTNLHAMEIDASFHETHEFKLKQEDGIGKMMQQLVSAFPGVDEAMGFAELMQSVQSMPYSVIVFDTAPTGHTLRLLSFPDLLDKMGSMQSKFGGIFQMVQSFADQDCREEEVQRKLGNLCSASDSVKNIFQDPTLCTFVCVCIPEFLSIYETERLIQELCKFGIDSSNIVVNQVLFPEDCGEFVSDHGNTSPDELEGLAAQLHTLTAALPDGSAGSAAAEVVQKAAQRMRELEKGWDMCQKKRRMQSKYLQQIADLYRDDFHICAVPMLGEEVRGVDKLQAFAQLLLRSDRGLPILGPTGDGNP
jgi:arsenite-transporting ATPase